MRSPDFVLPDLDTRGSVLDGMTRRLLQAGATHHLGCRALVQLADQAEQWSSSNCPPDLAREDGWMEAADHLNTCTEPAPQAVEF